MSEDSNAWVFDSLICFLHGPVWNAPLQSFIEEKSLIFDPNENTDENNPEYKKIHDEYKHLVDYMLSTFMEEMQITPEQFEVACLAGKQNNSTSGLTFHQGLFQQIWAANDIRIFIRMMTQRNVELQLQVLDVIERRHLTSMSSKDEPSDSSEPADTGSSTPNARRTLDDITQEEMEKIVADKLKEEQDQLPESPVATENEDLAQASPTLKEEDVTNRMQRLNLFFKKQQEVDAADIKSRQAYLRAQRDKIVAIKKKVRTNQLNENVKKNGRPQSARAAQKLLDGDSKLDTESMEASLQLRKTLAKRLRNEVVAPEA